MNGKTRHKIRCLFFCPAPSVDASGVFLRLCRDLGVTDFETASTTAEDVRAGGALGECFEATVHFVVKLCNKFSLLFSVLLEFH